MGLRSHYCGFIPYSNSHIDDKDALRLLYLCKIKLIILNQNFFSYIQSNNDYLTILISDEMSLPAGTFELAR